MRIATLLLAGLFLLPPALAPATAQAATVDSVTDPAVAAVVDGRAIPVRLVEMMLATARRGSKDITFNRTLDTLVENQLLARDAVREHGRDFLLRPDRVGYAPQVTLETQYTTLIKQHFFRQIDADVKARPGGNLDGLVTWRIAASDPALAELLTLRNRGEVRLTQEQLELGRKTTIARMTLPDGSRKDITFGEIHDRLNVQGRVQLLQDRDRRFLDERVQARVEALFLVWWADKRSGLTPADTRLLRAFLEEKFLRDQYLFLLGVVSVIHEDTPPFLTRLESQVTREEIRGWYATNREQFRQVEKVRARHIRCATEQACEQAYQAVIDGMEFSAAARRFSIADTARAEPAGSLGWLVRSGKNLPWIAQIALIQKEGETTRPIRTPEDASGKAFWEIVRVDERVEGYSPPESETVAYLARQEIARRKAAEHYQALRDRLLAKADIRRNGGLLKARHTAIDDAPVAPPEDGHDDHDNGHRH